MTKKAKNEAQYHSKESLIPRTVAPGVQMWSAALERTMFTHFEIEPKCRFDMHSHVNEQITMVLEGELFFETKDRVLCVKKGEVIAIPANTPHAAFTKASSVIAVDAWSPIVEKYLNEKYCSLENEIILSGCIGMKP